MFGILKNIFKPKSSPEPELDKSITLEGHDKRFFEQALKLYIFIRHVPHKNLKPELAEQMGYLGNIVYSLILNWLKDGKPSIEYMDFLNTKLAEIQNLPESALAGLQIHPKDVNDMELMDTVRLKFRDEETGGTEYLRYDRGSGKCKYHDLEGFGA